MNKILYLTFLITISLFLNACGNSHIIDESQIPGFTGVVQNQDGDITPPALNARATNGARELRFVMTIETEQTKDVVLKNLINDGLILSYAIENGTHFSFDGSSPSNTCSANIGALSNCLRSIKFTASLPGTYNDNLLVTFAKISNPTDTEVLTFPLIGEKTISSPPVAMIHCGDIITTSITVGNDLVCPGNIPYAIKVIGRDVVINGNNHTISAPDAVTGIFVQGDQITVNNYTINNIINGSGIFAFDSEGLKILNNNLSNNFIGLKVSSQNIVLNNITIFGNIITDSILFAIKTEFSGSGAVNYPVITENDLSRSGNYALYLMATNVELNSDHSNIYTGSNNGIYLALGNFVIHDFDMSQSGAKKIQIFIDSAIYVSVTNVNVTGSQPIAPSQERIGIDLYRVGTFEIKNVIASYNDAGIKFENELGTTPSGFVQNCTFIDDTTAGILVVSYDGSAYGDLDLRTNFWTLPSTAYKVLIMPNTVIGPNSTLP
ncbi:MAG: hypothetical protein ACOYL6_05795 [Bacteriovoracaceae bacterium]